LKAIVTTIKPELVVETGTCFPARCSTLCASAECRLKANGCWPALDHSGEYDDSKVFAAAKREALRFARFGIKREWIDARATNPSLEIERWMDGIDLLYFADSDGADSSRAGRSRHFLPAR